MAAVNTILSADLDEQPPPFNVFGGGVKTSAPTKGSGQKPAGKSKKALAEAAAAEDDEEVDVGKGPHYKKQPRKRGNKSQAAWVDDEAAAGEPYLTPEANVVQFMSRQQRKKLIKDEYYIICPGCDLHSWAHFGNDKCRGCKADLDYGSILRASETPIAAGARFKVKTTEEEAEEIVEAEAAAKGPSKRSRIALRFRWWGCLRILAMSQG